MTVGVLHLTVIPVKMKTFITEIDLSDRRLFVCRQVRKSKLDKKNRLDSANAGWIIPELIK